MSRDRSSRLLQTLRALTLLAAVVPALASAAFTRDEQRAAYRQALEHLTAGRSSAFRETRRALDGYPLARYLDYYQLRSRLGSRTDAQMQAFLGTHGDLPAVDILHYHWLKQLGASAQWQRLLDNPRETTDPELRCYQQRALLATDRRHEAFAGVAELWTVPGSQPKACDPLFDAWIAADRLTEGRAWERLRLALEAGERRLGRYLLRFFDGPLESWARALYDVHVTPARVAGPGAFTEDTPYSRVVIAHGLKRLAARDPELAARAWQRYQDTHRFSAGDAQLLLETITLAQARAGNFPTGRMSGLSADFYAGMADAAVRAQRWADVHFYIEEMPLEQRMDLRWQYWLARALTQTQLGAERARLTYLALARERNYYGFLAANHLGLDPRMNPAEQATDEAQLATVMTVPGVERALELYAVGDLLNARREWFRVLPELDPVQQFHAAVLARNAGWTALGISTANAADLRDNLELRFPIAYGDLFRTTSETTAVPEPFLLAVARQESAFDPRARSRANARGLMQLMHPTATMVATHLGSAKPSQVQLYDPAVNVNLGGHHLARLLDRYDNRRPLAAAAYNAGEHRVDRWVRQQSGVPMDVWIESIPFHETRNYVKNVLAFTQVYGHLLGNVEPILRKDESTLN